VRKIFLATILMFFILLLNYSSACVGKTLYIGILSTPNEQVLAEMVSILTTERTGTTVKIVQFKESKELYAAVKKGDVGVIIETLDRGAAMTGKSTDTTQKSGFDALKNDYRKNLNLVWLDQFGEGKHYAPLISVDAMTSLPALPKLVGKLANSLTNESYNRLLKTAAAEGNTQKVMRSFLKSKKLI